MVLYQKSRSRVLLDYARAYALYQLAKRQQEIPGDYLELGSYRLGTALLLSLGDRLVSKKIYFLDSFEGLPKVSIYDKYWKKGDMGKISFDEIKQFAKMNLVQTPCQLIKGFFPEQTDLQSLPGQLSFVHIDTDLYQPTLDGLNTFYPKLAGGGGGQCLLTITATFLAQE